MTSIDITIGWTKSNLDHGYSSFIHGYLPGAEQHEETVTVEIEDEFCTRPDLPYKVAEAVFVATNAPGEQQGLPKLILEALVATGYYGQGAHWSLSTGDTVTLGEIRLECVSLGWKRVHEGVPS